MCLTSDTCTITHSDDVCLTSDTCTITHSDDVCLTSDTCTITHSDDVCLTSDTCTITHSDDVCLTSDTSTITHSDDGTSSRTQIGTVAAFWSRKKGEKVATLVRPDAAKVIERPTCTDEDIKLFVDNNYSKSLHKRSKHTKSKLGKIT